MSTKTYPDSVVSWPEIVGTKYGTLAAFEATIPADVSGRLDIWKVPATSDNPDGYWVNLFNGRDYEEVIPGFCSWEQKCLAKIRFTAPTDENDENSSTASGRTVGVEDKDPVLPDFDEAVLNQPAVEEE